MYDSKAEANADNAIARSQAPAPAVQCSRGVSSAARGHEGDAIPSLAYIMRDHAHPLSLAPPLTSTLRACLSSVY